MTKKANYLLSALMLPNTINKNLNYLILIDINKSERD